MKRTTVPSERRNGGEEEEVRFLQGLLSKCQKERCKLLWKTGMDKGVFWQVGMEIGYDSWQKHTVHGNLELVDVRTVCGLPFCCG